MSKRILVIEDQQDNRQILRDLLTSADFEVIEAEDGESGLTAAAAHRPGVSHEMMNSREQRLSSWSNAT
jgi:CheY-like chemotaxis protein